MSDQKKWAVVNEERAKRREEFGERLPQIKCFWTRPLGHKYAWNDEKRGMCCVGCGRYQTYTI